MADGGTMTAVHEDELGELARRQGGVFARRQALALGFSHFVISRRVETRLWRPVLGSVLAATTTELDELSMEWSAYLAGGPQSVLSGPSALRRHGLTNESDPQHWITIPPERHVRLNGVRVIRERVDPGDIVDADGMRVTSIPRSVVDTLRVVPEFLGQSLVDRALLRGWLTMAELEERVHQFAGRRGIGRLRTHLTRVRGGARSEAERRLHELLTLAEVTGWEADFKIYDEDGALVAVVDVAFAGSRLAIEVDGLAFHTDPARFQSDRRRQNTLVNLGWTVLRFTWDDLTQRHQHVIRTIRTALDR